MRAALLGLAGFVSGACEFEIDNSGRPGATVTVETTDTESEAGSTTGYADEGSCEPTDEPSLEIGYGASEFNSLDVVSVVGVESGIQGGYHTTMALRADGLAITGPRVARLQGYIDTTKMADVQPVLRFRCNPPQGEISTGILLIWDAYPWDLHQQEAHVVVEMTDERDRVIKAEVDFTLLDPEQLDG